MTQPLKERLVAVNGADGFKILRSNNHRNPDGPEALAEIERLERIIARQHRQSGTNRTFWVRAAKAAMAGDMRELRNRVDLAEAPPVDVVLSNEATNDRQ